MKVRQRGIWWGVLIFGLLIVSHDCWAQEADINNIELGEEYSQYNKGRAASGTRSKKTNSCKPCAAKARALRKVLFYLPNRLIDLWDVFRVDVGIGGSYGGVLRVSRYAQAGYREVPWGSLRIGMRGRQNPFLYETRSEYGLGPNFVNSSQRPVTPAEVGVGLDLLVPAAYVGLSFDELIDFVGGIFTYDPSGDDY